jgi:hypothetical protein
VKALFWSPFFHSVPSILSNRWKVLLLLPLMFPLGYLHAAHRQVKLFYAFHPIPDITILNVSKLECCIDWALFTGLHGRQYNKSDMWLG